jgi:hypothetical protein
VLLALVRELVPFNYVVPSQSDNTLVDLDHVLVRAGNLAAIRVAQETRGGLNEPDCPDFLLSKNEFSGPDYRIVHFVAEVPVRIDRVLPVQTPRLSGLGPVVFGTTEFQVVDRATALRNETVFIGVRPWEGQRTGTTGNLLDALEQALTAQPWPETDLTLLLVSTPPARGSTPTEWAFATVGRPMGVIRSLRAHRSPDDPEGLARAEALQVVRVLARVVGAMPPCSAAWMWQDLVTWPAGDENIPLPHPDELQTMSAVRSALGPSLRGALDPVLAQRLLAT